MIFKISTAWLQLKHEKIRLMVAIGGISFAVVLIFMQLGLRVALFDSAVAFYSKLEADIFLLSPRSTALIAMENFSERRLDQTLAFPEVKNVIPIYLGFAQWKNPQTRNYWRNIYVIGFELNKNVFNLSGFNNNLDKLKEPDMVLFDAKSRTEFGPIVELFNQQGKVETEIGDRGPNNRKITVGGLFEIGTSFGSDGNLITSDLNFLRIFIQRKKGFINLGIIQLHPGYNPEQVIRKLKDYLPPDIRVMNRQELMDFEKEYWNTTTPIGFVFTFGVILGTIVGIIIVYQILYSNVSEHLAEYATLKAMGYKHKYLLTVIFQEALILAILGYIPGFLITLSMYQAAQQATRLPITMETTRALTVLFLTILICFSSGAIAVRKLQDADPADIF
ncbi:MULTISPECIES: ABC transporter permease DevC [Nostocales]|uniref:FtsX-like permease family protein n=1 Tax=Dolichospermum flos-aquae UHCC 0037 TaxID=2590026 RepID=A0ACC7SAY1_DOLFA|nr:MULTISPECIES: ABC transporter permease DevC [Nostocales]MBO1067343.1 FtsX-like permease family protein [Anabaena sp. 54]MTJ44989.1 FtsX-like permease family protein [Dolichospermum flos-aquae UHCC 0037]